MASAVTSGPIPSPGTVVILAFIAYTSGCRANNFFNACACRAAEQGDEILIVNPLLSIRKICKASISGVELRGGNVVTKFGVAQRERVASGMFAEHERVRRNADRLRRHDLVAERIVNHAVLVNARFMRERVAAYDRFVWLHVETDYTR